MRGTLTPIALLLMLTGPLAAQRSIGIDQWTVRGTAPLTLTLPAATVPDRILARSADGTWHELESLTRDGAVKILVHSEQMAGGSTQIVFDPPRWLSLEDVGPPAVEQFLIDGRDVSDRSSVSLGWIAQMPESITLQVRDDANPIDRGSLRARTPIGYFKPRDPGVSFSPEGPRAGTLTVRPGEIPALDEVTQGRIELVVDNYAIDDEETVRSVSWALAPSMALEDGTKLIVSSITSEARWQDWQVVADGAAMSEGDPTTSGVTWLSERSEGEHWIRWDFPESREVTGVQLDWAWWETWRTSRNYDVQVRHNDVWTTVTEVRNQREKSTSEHRFEPVAAMGVRVVQMPMGGHSGRLDLMWLANAEVFCAE